MKYSTAEAIEKNGFALVEAVIDDRELVLLIAAIESLTPSSAQAGQRHLLKRSLAVRNFARSKKMLALASLAAGSKARPVKAILFDKTEGANWYVTWHQDLTIAVHERKDVEGFGPWSMKDGVPHVRPTLDVLQDMIALRVHLDDCPADNGAIKFIPGSHRSGVLDGDAISQWRGRVQVYGAAKRGDIIVMRPLILHSSSPSVNPKNRRVLHFESATQDLPAGLKWAEASGLDGVETSD